MTTSITLGAVNLEATDPVALADFWAHVTGGSAEAYGDFVYLSAGSPDGFSMFFQPLTAAASEHQKTHLDLTVPWGSRVSEVERLVGLGATWRWDVLEEFPHVQWTTLADPEGNLFCVAEHPPAAG